VRVAFLGHQQPTDSSRPAGGYISKSEAEALVRLMAAERISQKRIRAFPPDTAFRCIQPEMLRSPLPSSELPGIKFVGPRNPVPHFVSTMGPDSGWDWSLEQASA
jgi:hypothetical protein